MTDIQLLLITALHALAVRGGAGGAGVVQCSAGHGNGDANCLLVRADDYLHMMQTCFPPALKHHDL